MYRLCTVGQFNSMLMFQIRYCSAKQEETIRREEGVQRVETEVAISQAGQLAREKFCNDFQKEQDEKMKWGRARRAVGSGQWH